MSALTAAADVTFSGWPEDKTAPFDCGDKANGNTPSCWVDDENLLSDTHRPYVASQFRTKDVLSNSGEPWTAQTMAATFSYGKNKYDLVTFPDDSWMIPTLESSITTRCQSSGQTLPGTTKVRTDTNMLQIWAFGIPEAGPNGVIFVNQLSIPQVPTAATRDQVRLVVGNFSAFAAIVHPNQINEHDAVACVQDDSLPPVINAYVNNTALRCETCRTASAFDGKGGYGAAYCRSGYCSSDGVCIAAPETGGIECRNHAGANYTVKPAKLDSFTYRNISTIYVGSPTYTTPTPTWHESLPFYAAYGMTNAELLAQTWLVLNGGKYGHVPDAAHFYGMNGMCSQPGAAQSQHVLGMHYLAAYGVDTIFEQFYYAMEHCHELCVLFSVNRHGCCQFDVDNINNALCRFFDHSNNIGDIYDKNGAEGWMSPSRFGVFMATELPTSLRFSAAATMNYGSVAVPATLMPAENWGMCSKVDQGNSLPFAYVIKESLTNCYNWCRTRVNLANEKATYTNGAGALYGSIAVERCSHFSYNEQVAECVDVSLLAIEMQDGISTFATRCTQLSNANGKVESDGSVKTGPFEWTNPGGNYRAYRMAEIDSGAVSLATLASTTVPVTTLVPDPSSAPTTNAPSAGPSLAPTTHAPSKGPSSAPTTHAPSKAPSSAPTPSNSNPPLPPPTKSSDGDHRLRHILIGIGVGTAVIGIVVGYTLWKSCKE